jgi:hypothetical protein
MIMTNPSNLGFVTVTVSDGWSNIKGAAAQKCGQLDLGTGSYDVKIEGFHAAGEVKEIVTYR